MAFNFPDLDILDTPLMSSTPFTPFTGVPGSAIAENIFNDPDSWLEPSPQLPRPRSPVSILSHPPPRSRTRSPAGSRPNSKSRCFQSPPSTSAQTISSRDSNGPTRRRLPSIPLEASPLPSPHSSSPIHSSTESPPLASQSSASSSRPHSVRTPLGPRTRASSRTCSIAAGASLLHRPPVLRI